MTEIGQVLVAISRVEETLGRHTSELAEIKAEVRATNGRVRTLELDKAVRDARSSFSSKLGWILIGSGLSLGSGSALIILKELMAG